jgi:hypothetical protein
MTVRCNLTEADYRAYRRHVFFRLRKMHWLYGGLLVLLLLITWLGGKPDENVTEKAFVLGGVLMMFGLICGITMVAFWAIRRFTGTRFRGPTGEHVFEISDSGLREANSLGATETRLAGIRRIDETSHHFFVFTTSGTGHIIPKQNAEILDALRALKEQLKNPQANWVAGSN